MISVKLAKANFTNTIKTIKRMLRSKNFDNTTRECLEYCRDLYGAAIPRLEEAVNELTRDSHADIDELISGTMELPTTCGDGFAEAEVASSLSNGENYNMFELCEIALFITDTLSSQQYLT
ncbi:hypothetical protein Scep_026360 [Stephania cephalantha]|uniref:Pectinesterase inhibitor domain-containing protein n=1 Tax=Stephania cephalantha TaxID=152367 RepID=A0AAP0HSG0_9MAGN